METKNLLITLLDGPEGLLHAIPTLRAIRAGYRDKEITLIADRSCEELADFLPSGITMGTVSNVNDTLPENTLHPELLIQLGLSSESLVLSSTIRAGETIGPRLEGSQLLLPEGWHRYAEIVKQDSYYNPFHKVDILRNFVKQVQEEENFELTVPENLHAAVAKYIPDEAHIKVAISLEGQEPEELHATIKAILALGLRLKIYLLGTVKDRRLSADLASQAPATEIIDLCGRLGLRECAAMAHASDILLCAPGTNAALAAGFGTFCICMDSSRGAESHRYPYGHGHLVVQKEKGSLSAENFGENIAHIVHFTVTGNNGSVPNQEHWQSYFDSRIDSLLGKLRIFITQRVQYLLDNGASRTEMQLHPLLFTGAELSDCMRSFYRLLWENSLNGFSLTATNLEILHEESIGLLCSLMAPLEQLYELADFGQKYIGFIRKHLKDNNLDKAKADSAHLQEVDDLIRILSNTHPALAPICQYFSLTQSQCCGTEIPELAEEFASAYRNLQQHVLILLDLQKSLYQTTYEREKLLQPPMEEGVSHG